METDSVAVPFAEPASFVVIDPNGHRMRVPIDPLPFEIGRQPGSNLILRDSRVSRAHARILVEDGRYVLEDRGVDWFRLEVEQRTGIRLQPARPFQFTKQGDLLGWHEQSNGKWFLGLSVENGRIIGIALDAKACVLTQASASILGGDATGLTRDEIAALHEAVHAMLADGGAKPGAPFNTYAHFDGVADHRNRHRCVLLPIEAVLVAFDALSEPEPKGLKR
jgi:sulfite reductase (NADPH) hemoprotein beta-component